MTDSEAVVAARERVAEALREAAEAVIHHGHDRTMHTVMDVADYLTDTANRIEESR